jgi:hypothetical protein
MTVPGSWGCQILRQSACESGKVVSPTHRPPLPPENILVHISVGARGGAVVEALRYNPEGRRFDSRWCHWIFHWHNPSCRTMALVSTQPLTEMSTRNISWGKGGQRVGLTTLPPSCADCLKIWEPQPLGNLKACNGIAFYTYLLEAESIPGP